LSVASVYCYLLHLLGNSWANVFERAAKESTKSLSFYPLQSHLELPSRLNSSNFCDFKRHK